MSSSNFLATPGKRKAADDVSSSSTSTAALTPRTKRRALSDLNGYAIFMWGQTRTIAHTVNSDGSNNNGDDDDDERFPVFVEALQGEKVQSISCARSGSETGYILTMDQKLKPWGPKLGGWASAKHRHRKVAKEPIVNGAVSQVASGFDHHACILAESGDLLTWGNAEFGKLGHSFAEDAPTTSMPQRVDDLEGIPIQQVACGTFHTVALARSGEVYSFGWNEDGLTGHGATEGNQLTPKRVEGIAHVSVKSIAAFGCYTVVLTTDGKVYSWGCGESDEKPFIDSAAPRLVERIQHVRIVQISVGLSHVLALTDKGLVYTWGMNPIHNVVTSEPSLVPNLQGIVRIDCFGAASFAVSERGVAYSWGSCENGNGQLGHGSTENIPEPRVIEKLQDHHVLNILCIDRYTFALVDHTSLPACDSIPISSVVGSMLNDAEFSDVSFIVEGRTLHAHRAILSRRCAYFGTMFRSGLRESTQLSIPISNARYEVFRLLLQWLYTDKISVDVDQALELYILADMYGLRRLLELCLYSMRQKLTPEKAGAQLQAAADSNCEPMKDICMDYILAHFVSVFGTDSMDNVRQSLLLEICKSYRLKLLQS